MQTIFIITSTLNCENEIKNCIESVLKVKNKINNGRIHHLIADGGSKDKTIFKINPYKGKDLTIVSTKDLGIYDAWNKCISFANLNCDNNHWFNFLGSDDYLTEDCVEYFNEIFLEKDKKINLFTAKSFISKNSFYEGLKSKSVFGKPLKINKLIHSMQISNSAAIYNYKLFQNNLFDINYKICGDYDFIIKNQKKIKSKHNQYIVSFVKYGGISISNPKKVIDESLRCRLKYYKFNPINIILIIFFALIRYLKLIIKLVFERKFF